MSGSRTRARVAGRHAGATGPAGPARWAGPACAALIVLATVAAYASSFGGAMVFDDGAAILDNETIRRLWPIGPVLSPPANGYPVQGRPVVNLSLAVNYAMGGANVWGYHAVNLLIHVLAALTLLGVVRRTLGVVDGKNGDSPRSPEKTGKTGDSPHFSAPLGAAALPLATAAALLWAVHPLQTESVTYISQRAESLVGLLFLLTLYCSIRASTSPRPAVWCAAAAGACLLGMGSKEVMVGAPLIVLLYDRAFLAGSFAGALRRRWGLYASLAATWGLLGWLVLGSAGRAGTAGFAAPISPAAYACTQFGAIVGYLRQSVWPSGLTFDYGTPLARGAAQIVPQAIVVALLLAATVTAMVRWKEWGFLGAWFFVILAPSSSVIPVATQTKAEHRMYLPLAAVVVLAVVGAYQLVCRGSPRRSTLPLETAPDRGLPARRVVRGTRRAGWILAACGAAVAVALACLTFQRNLDYRSAFSIWNDTVAKCPGNARAYNNRGFAYAGMGRRAEALRDYDRSIQLDPNCAETYFKRGGEYLNSGGYAQAVADLGRAIELQPDYVAAYGNRAVALIKLGQYEQALRDCDKAIELNADFVGAYVNRAYAHRKLGRESLALRDYDRALQLKPDYAEMYVNRAEVWYVLKEYDRAWADIRAGRKLGARPDPVLIQRLAAASGRSE